MASFLSLPGELRNMIYKQMLVLDDPIDPVFGTEKFLLEPAILRTNRSIHRESSSLLYGQNWFDFAGLEHHFVDQFLDQIGRENARYIQNIRISFPHISDVEELLNLGDHGAIILAKLESDCINLRTITMDPESTSVMELTLGAFDSLEIVTRALSLTNRRLRAFPHLERITVEVFDDEPSAHIREEMDRLGWRIITVEQDWDYERHLSDFDEVEYSDDDFSEDDYDIDDDSDFWRRAAD